MDRPKWAVVILIAMVAMLVLIWSWRSNDGSHGPDRHVASGRRPVAVVGPNGSTLRYAWLGQRGLRGQRIAGRVVHGGAPVPNARARLVTEELNVGEWILGEVTTDASGRFDFGVAPPTRLRVVAQADGLVATGVEVDLRKPNLDPPPSALEIELRDCSLVITGTVRDAAGGVIPAARVRGGTYAEEFGFTVADAAGNYRLCESAGTVHLEASADGYGTALEHRTGRREMRVDFALSAEVVIAGRVVDGSGAPVAAVGVAAETDGHEPGSFAESDDDGKFRLDGLAPGPYRVTARAPGRAAERRVLTNRAATLRIELVLEPHDDVNGRVTVDGQAAGRAVVTVKDTDPFRARTFESAVAQADGRFVLSYLPAKGNARIEVEGMKLLEPSGTVELTELKGHELQLVGQRLAKVSGRVIREGKPVARTAVWVWIAAEQARRESLSKADGSFELDGVPFGTVPIHALNVQEGVLMAPLDLEVGPKGISGLVLELDRASSIAGVVVDAAGAPVAGVRVFAQLDQDGSSDVTTKDGSFTCTGLAGGGGYVARVVREGPGELPYRPASGGAFDAIPVADGRTHVTGVRLAIARDDLSISGRVLRAGQPAAGVPVMAWNERAESSRAETGADGSFVVGGLSAGKYSLRASGAQHVLTFPERLSANAGDANVQIDLPSTGTIEGELHGFEGTTYVFAMSGAMADVNGDRFTLSEAPMGEETISARDTNGAVAAAKVTLTADATAHVSLQASGTGRLEGAVRDWRTRAPVTNVSCVWQTSEAGSGPIPVGDTGTFSTVVAARPVTVQCYQPLSPVTQARTVAVEVAPGKTAHVEVLLVVPRYPSANEYFQVGFGGDPVRVEYAVGNAGESGIMRGDRVQSINGLPVLGLDPSAMFQLLRDHPPDRPAVLTVERNGTVTSVEVEPEAAPPSNFVHSTTRVIP